MIFQKFDPAKTNILFVKTTVKGLILSMNKINIIKNNFKTLFST